MCPDLGELGGGGGGGMKDLHYNTSVLIIHCGFVPLLDKQRDPPQLQTLLVSVLSGFQAGVAS